MATNQKASDISCQGNAILSLIATASKGNVFADIVLVKDVGDAVMTVLPLVSGANVSGGEIKCQEVYDIPFIRYQAGNSAVKMIPRIGDIGLVIACDKDTTNVRASRQSGATANSAAPLILGCCLHHCYR